MFGCVRSFVRLSSATQDASECLEERSHQRRGGEMTSFGILKRGESLEEKGGEVTKDERVSPTAKEGR